MGNRFISNLFKSGEEFEEFLQKLEAFKEGVKDGSIVIPKASYASSAGLAGSATKATQDGDGNVIPDTYAKKSDLTSGAITVKKATQATSATTAGSATKATQDGDGNAIPDTYAKKAELTGGSLKVAKSTSADSATKATQDGDGNAIPDTYAKKSDLTSGAIIAKKAEESAAYPFEKITGDAQRSLNEATFCVTGRWYFHHRDKSATNAWKDMPNDCTNGWLETYQSPTTSTICDQIFHRAGSANNYFEIYTRTRNSSGEWSAWRRLATKEELESGDIIVSRAYADKDGLVINQAYAKIYDLDRGNIVVASASKAATANHATTATKLSLAMNTFTIDYTVSATVTLPLDYGSSYLFRFTENFTSTAVGRLSGSVILSIPSLVELGEHKYAKVHSNIGNLGYFVRLVYHPYNTELTLELFDFHNGYWKDYTVGGERDDTTIKFSYSEIIY